MNGLNLYWGDLHTHLEDLDSADQILHAASENIDFCAVLLYPFVYEFIHGFRVESVGERPEFQAQWEKVNELSRRFDSPGRFTTFPGYEWHGNRTRYGDHNVIFLEEGQSLDGAWSLETLYANLKNRSAMVIPHHTGYAVGSRGKDWNIFDEALSPVMEVFSAHGSSEGVRAPHFLAGNTSMGPGTSGGTFQDALKQGLRIGVIGSNDGPGLPGRWGLGRAGVWARENSREAIWEAICNRRTYAVSGDRIVVNFRIGDAVMGSTVRSQEPPDVFVSAVGSHAIERIELIQNGCVVDSYHHSAGYRAPTVFPGRIKVFVEAGWGPASHNGFELAHGRWDWHCELVVQSGRLASVEKCFSLLGQRVIFQDDQHCAWEFSTAVRRTRHPHGLCQGLIFELEGNIDTTLAFKVEGQQLRIPVRELLTRSILVPLVDEVREMVKDAFGLQDVANPDAFYQNARKFKVHQAIPEQSFAATHTFRNIELTEGINSFYVRITQRNGQMAWSSPIWVNAQKSSGTRLP